jgi:hypothetical protein
MRKRWHFTNIVIALHGLWVDVRGFYRLTGLGDDTFALVFIITLDGISNNFVN